MSNNNQSAIAIIENKFGKQVQIEKKYNSSWVTAENNLHYDIIKVLIDSDEKTAIAAITGLDLGEKLGVYYHLRTSNDFLTIKSHVPKENPRIKTIIDIHPGAAFHELEAADLLGILFDGHAMSGHFVLSEYWPKGVYPLRKDVNPNEIKLTPPQEQNKPPEDGRLVKIIIGPQHPALLEPEKFAVTVDGEIVTKVEPRIGYVHRGIEKSTESRTYLRDIYLVERICGICNSIHAMGFVGGVEKLMHLDVPPRAKYLRIVDLELNRLHSHLLTLGHAALEIGYETIFQYFWRDREPIMDLIELTTGNRLYSSQITIGGVRRDIQENDIPKIKTTLKALQDKLPFYRKVYEEEPTIKLRMQNVGVLKKQDALKLAVVGPVARGSGVDIDVRKDEPYQAYGEIPFKEIVYTEGDTWARMNVRMDEVSESIDIINYALDHLPSGVTRLDVPRSVPAGEAVNRVEAPRGELFYFIRSNGTDMPDRVKVRTPTFANIPSFLQTAIGESIADVPANFVSLDPCFSCTDR